MKRTILTALGFLPIVCFAATFIVSNNNADGNGSLRQALQLAAENGTSVKDSILFNISENQTSIVVSAPLTLSSNLVVDGTSQPGKAFGQTNAKIRIMASACVNGFEINGLDNVEVYGFWFTGFTIAATGCSNGALVLKNAKRIIIGQPTKGNCFTNNTQSITSLWQPGETGENEQITIQGNRFGMDTLSAPDYTATSLQFGASRQLFFGGDAINQGNRIGNGYVSVGNAFTKLSHNGDTIAFKNNAFGFDAFNGPLLSAIGFGITGMAASKSQLTVIIKNNKVGMDDQANKIQLTDIKGNISITNNYIGSLNTAVTPNDKVVAVYLNGCEKKDSIVVNNNTINGYLTGVHVINTPGVTISKNVIYCNQKGIRYNNLTNIPIITLTGLYSTVLQGTTKPFSKVEVFSTNTCTNFCENGYSYLGEVYADVGGRFEFRGALQNTISLTATASDGTTGEFYGPKILDNYAAVKNATCNAKNGLVKGMKILQGITFWWEDAIGTQVGTDTVLSNVGAGKYRLRVFDKYSLCPTLSSYFTIESIAKPTTDSNFTATATACGKYKGQLTSNGNNSTGADNVWLDSLLVAKQYSGRVASNLAPGKYYYRVFLKEDTACYSQYGPFEILDAKGPAIIDSAVAILPSACNSANGSIHHITLANTVGNSFVGWQDSVGNTVANTLNLTNVPAGRYRLLAKDESVCDTLFSGYYTIPAKGGITIDSSQRIIRPSKCIANTGAISQLTVTGADGLQWINTNNKMVVGTGVDLYNVPAGIYQLAAFNNIGCSDTSLPMVVPQQNFVPITYTRLTTVQPSCNQSNGKAQPIGFSTDTLYYKFMWMDSISGNPLSSNLSLQNVNTGNYALVATDSNGCNSTLAKVALQQTGQPVFNVSGLQIGSDTCRQSLGFIKSLKVENGQQPYVWHWFKNTNTVPFAQTSGRLSGIDKGTYHAIVTDSAGCMVTSNKFVIGDFEKILEAPTASNVSVPRNTPAQLVIKNAVAGSYLLFDTLTAMLPLQIGTGPTLRTPPVLYDKTFYLQYKLGDCQSSKVPVLIKVTDKATVSLTNAFSPNGDGINDVWKLTVQGTINIKEWRLFNRSGQQVWQTTNAAASWDGRTNGSAAPVGTYYYIVSATDNNGAPIQLNGTVTLLR